ncbi:DedA family protein [Nocardiopsis ganjiahuensis]|uniref:DedA family protein n=1 Tax=Nocardiopsis ganjiahuensis TaxID=239984 RepID=UPI000344C181|nr:VTT domain-containing protein [Nocardiopsis ganjiahuensis]
MTTKTDTPQGPGEENTAGSAPRPTREEAVKAAGKAWDLEEGERAKAEMKGMRPWPKVMTRQDKILLWCLIGIPAFFLLTMPLRPLFIADHPIPLAFATGSHAAVGAASAYVAVGEGSMWLVIVAGVFGKIKIDWLFWWVGRRWGRGIVNFLVPSERGRRFATRLETMNPWVMRLFIPLSYLPGVPGGVPHIIAGVSGMRLRTFMLLDALGALMVTAAVAGIGYASGQSGVDVVLLVDKYALWVMFALIFGMAILPTIPAIRDQRARRAQVLKEAGEAYDAETERLAAGIGPDAGSDSAAGAAAGETSQVVPAPEAPRVSSKDV